MTQRENNGSNKLEAPDGFEEIMELTQEEKRELLEMWKARTENRQVVSNSEIFESISL